MVLKPLGENWSESRSAESVLDLRHDVVCSCRLVRVDLRVVAPTRLDCEARDSHRYRSAPLVKNGELVSSAAHLIHFFQAGPVILGI